MYDEHAYILACERKCNVDLASVDTHVGPQSSSQVWTPIARQKMLGHLIRKATLLKNCHALVKKPLFLTLVEYYGTRYAEKSIWHLGASEPQTVWQYKG